MADSRLHTTVVGYRQVFKSLFGRMRTLMGDHIRTGSHNQPIPRYNGLRDVLWVYKV